MVAISVKVVSPGKKGICILAPEWFREEGDKEEDPCCQGESLVLGPWIQVAGDRVYFYLLVTSTQSLQQSML